MPPPAAPAQPRAAASSLVVMAAAPAPAPAPLAPPGAPATRSPGGRGVAFAGTGAAVLATAALEISGHAELARNAESLLPLAWLLLLRAARGSPRRGAAAEAGEGGLLCGWQMGLVYLWAVSQLLVLVAAAASSALEPRAADAAPGPLLLRNVVIVAGVVATPLVFGWWARTGRDALVTVLLSGLALMSTVLPARGGGATAVIGGAPVAIDRVYAATLALLAIVLVIEGVRDRARGRALARRLHGLAGA